MYLPGEISFWALDKKACRSCRAIENKEWYERHQTDQRKRVRDHKIKNREVAQRFIYEYLSYQKCVDYGEYDFSVLTFDHVRGKKKKEISRMITDGDSIDAILQEIAKYQVVCASCPYETGTEGPDRGTVSEVLARLASQEAILPWFLISSKTNSAFSTNHPENPSSSQTKL
jgi:hypothetical protein